MARGRLRLTLALAACLAPAAAGADRPRLLEDPAPVRREAEPVRRVSADLSDDRPPPPVRPRIDDPFPLVRLADDDETRPPRRKPVRLSRAADASTAAADEVERSEPRRRVTDNLFDLFDRRSPLGRERDRERLSWKLGDRVRDMFNPEVRRDWFFSDHAFDHFASPITNPFLFEDPRALTEVRPLFVYQKVPARQPNFRGGNLYFFGARGSLALTERLSFTVNKLGAVAVAPSGRSGFDSEFGFAEVWFGPKFALLRDPQFGSILSAGAIFQVPTGQEKVFQDTGRLSIAPYLSYGKTLTEFRRLGTLNGMMNGGYSFSTDRRRSEYFYLNGHLDFDVLNRQRFYPVLECNWMQYTTNGRERTVSGEGRDLINFGSAAKGSNLVTGAVGFRFKIIEAAQLGAAYEFPLIGNRDFFQHRFTMDVIFRY